MKINFGKNLIRTVVQTNAYETREFEKLSYFRKQEILTEIFQRAFLSVWKNVVKNTEWHKQRVCSKKENEDELLNKKSLDQTMNVYSKAMFAEEYESNKRKKHKATAKINFSYNEDNGILDVEIDEFKTIEPKYEEIFKYSLNKELEEVKSSIEKSVKESIEERFDIRIFLKCFYDTLHIHELTSVTGNDASNVYQIFMNAKESYPLFKKEKYTTQLDILRKGYRLAINSPGNSRDINSFAKGVFEAIATHGDGYLTKKIYAKEKATERYANFTKVFEKREDRYDPEHPSTVWEKDALIFATYEHTTICHGSVTTLRTSFLAFDLWHMLVGNIEFEYFV